MSGNMPFADLAAFVAVPLLFVETGSKVEDVLNTRLVNVVSRSGVVTVTLKVETA